MWQAAAAEAMTGTVGQRGDVFRYAYKPIRRSACAAVVKLEFWEIFGYAAMIFRPDFAPPQRVNIPFMRGRRL